MIATNSTDAQSAIPIMVNCSSARVRCDGRRLSLAARRSSSVIIMAMRSYHGGSGKARACPAALNDEPLRQPGGLFHASIDRGPGWEIMLPQMRYGLSGRASRGCTLADVYRPTEFSHSRWGSDYRCRFYSCPAIRL
jgi:hypothetical protein